MLIATVHILCVRIQWTAVALWICLRGSVILFSCVGTREAGISSAAAGDLIPSYGEVLQGVAYVNESAITGESAPVIKEPGTDISPSVTVGTMIITDSLVIRITAYPGQTFIDRMIALVEGAARQKTPNEIALNILLGKCQNSGQGLSMMLFIGYP